MNNAGGSFKFDGVSLAAGVMAASSAFTIAYGIANSDGNVNFFEGILIFLNSTGAFLTALFQSNRPGLVFPPENKPKE